MQTRSKSKKPTPHAESNKESSADILDNINKDFQSYEE